MALKNFVDRFTSQGQQGASGEVEKGNIDVDPSLQPQLTFQALKEYNEKFPEPTQEEYATLPKTLGYAPFATYCICLIEFAERASYYGVKDRLSNFIQLPLPTGGNGAGAPPSGTQQNAGALGLGLQTASAVTLLLTFLAYLTPLWGGYISDKKWGRMKTIWWGVWCGATAHIILIIAAIPSVIQGGHALAPTIIAILVLALGTGLIKPNLMPLLFDQYPHKRDVVETREDGSRVILIRESSLERMTLVFYWSINVGSFLSVGTSYSAKRVGFWLAFLVPGIIYFVMVPVLIILAPRMKKETPSGVSVIGEFFKTMRYAFRGNFIQRSKQNMFWVYPRPTEMVKRGELSTVDDLNEKGAKKISWTDQFVEDVRVTMDACKIFIFFVIYNINDGGIGSLQNSQSIAMTTNGVPNDLISNFNPLTIIVLIPILDYGFYPLLRKWNISFPPAHRIFFGFMLAAFSQVAGAVIQYYLYQTSPCGYHASDCSVGTGVSHITVWVECVLYVLQASSECFANTAAYEIAYTRAPDSMKGLVMALQLFTQSLSAAISEACTSALTDPNLIWPFVACAIAGVLSALLFIYLYKDLHIVMEQERVIKEEKIKEQFMLSLQQNDKDWENKIGSDFSATPLEKNEKNELAAVISADVSLRGDEAEVTSITQSGLAAVLSKR